MQVQHNPFYKTGCVVKLSCRTIAHENCFKQYGNFPGLNLKYFLGKFE